MTSSVHHVTTSLDVTMDGNVGSTGRTNATTADAVTLSSSSFINQRLPSLEHFQFQLPTAVSDDDGFQAEEHRYPGAAELLAFHDWYSRYHGYAATVVCVLGIIANGVNIVVLTRPSMRSPINCILTGLAVSDGLTMAAYLPFALRFYVMYGVEMSPERNELSAVNFLLFYARFSVVVHTTSIWLTVVLATFRFVIVRSASRLGSG